MGSGSLFLLLFIFILGGGYFAASETAFASSNRIRLKNLADNGDKRARKALYITSNFDKALTTLLIGNNLMHICGASLGTLIAARIWGMGAVAVFTGIITIVVFLFSEMLPKSFAKARSESVALAVAGSLCFFMKLLSPVVFLLNRLGRGLNRFVAKGTEPTVTEDELYEIIETITEEGGIDSDKSELITSALEFADVTAQDVITSRVDMIAVDADISHEGILDIIRREKFSRLPVYEDNSDNIIGVLQIRKYLRAYLKGGESVDIRELLDEAYFVHKTIKIDELLSEMSNKKLHMSVVTDDYGGTMGIVTVEDILEELVGEIWDEDDEIVEEFSVVDNGVFEISGDLSAQNAFESMGIEDCDWEKLEHKTMGAWALENIEAVPKQGYSFEAMGLRITVKSVDHQRIKSLTVTVPHQITL